MTDFRHFILLLLSSCALVGCLDEELCDRASLQAALDAAASGDVVEMGACEVDGPLEVPAGVTLRGRGADVSRVRVPEREVGLRLEPGTEPTQLASLSVTSEGCAGVLARGQGSAVLRDVDVRAERGIGIGAEALDGLELLRVTLEGALTPEMADETIPPNPPYRCGDMGPATHGIVAFEVAGARFEALSVTGFAAFGALVVDSDLVWEGGDATANLGAGLEAWGGDTRLVGVTLCGTRQGIGPIEAYNGVFGGGGVVESERLEVCEGDAYGLMHDDSVAVHRDLVAEDNGFAGVWAQHTAGVELLGATTILRNGFAGVGAVAVDALRVEGGVVGDTRPGVAVVSTAGSVRAADGFHLLGSGGTIREVDVVDNERVGLVLDLQEDEFELTLADVRVRGEGDELGAIVQNGDVPPDWDEGLIREGAPVDNDPAFEGVLDVAEAVAPSCIPSPAGIETGGLDGLVTP